MSSSELPSAVLAQVVEVGPDRALVQLLVTPGLHQPYGIVHGGVYCALAEQAAELGARAWLGDRGVPRTTAVGSQFLRSVREGTLRAEATPVHRGRGQQLWTVRVSVSGPDGGGTGRVATAEVRLANLPT